MKVRVKNDSVEIEGYVNAVERESKTLPSVLGEFVEKIKAGAFGRALERNRNVRLFHNHLWEIGSQQDGNLSLYEDSIGLYAQATVTDPDVVDKAKNGRLVGWSFGFQDIDVDVDAEVKPALRTVKDLELFEVSILDDSTTPAYDGTLVKVRDGEVTHYRNTDTNVELVDCTEKRTVDYSKYEDIIKSLKEE